MFLFTTPTPAPQPGSAPAGGPVVDAIRQGAQQTGTDFGYLLDTAKRESALDPAAKAPTSSATGLFQFIEQTWLGLVKSEGGKLGLTDLANSISARPDGGLAVSDPAARQTILKLRENPSLSAMMAGTLTQQNREALTAATGREPSSGELYMAHLLGARGATDLIRSADRTPDRSAALDLPDAAAANRPIFYDRSGRARSAGEVYGVLAAGQSGDVAAAPPADAGTTPPLPRLDGPVLYGLFQTDRRTGPISDAVAKLWKVGGRSAAAASTGPAAPGFFPRVDGATPGLQATSDVAAAVPPTAPDAASGTAASVPLPPARPRDLDAPSAARAAQATSVARRRS